MRRDIEFNAEGTILRGWLYLPDNPAGRVPGVVMAHGFTAVKEMYLDTYAEVFAAAGLGVVVFDHRNFGASAGEPRGEIDPWAQVRDYRHHPHQPYPAAARRRHRRQPDRYGPDAGGLRAGFAAQAPRADPGRALRPLRAGVSDLERRRPGLVPPPSLRPQSGRNGLTLRA